MNNGIITAQCDARLHVSKAAEVITEVARRIADALESQVKTSAPR